MERVVLVSATNFERFCPEAKALLEENGFRIISNPHQRPWTAGEMEGFIDQCHAAIGGNEDWDADFIAKAHNMKIYNRFGVGLDNVDIAAAQAAGISVANCKGLNAVSVANMAVGLMLSVMRKIPEFHIKTVAGVWPRMMSHDLDGKTVGFLGFGDIARKVAKRISGFEVTKLAYDLFPNPEAAAELDATYVDLDTLLAESDVVTVHLPHIPATHGMIDAAFLAKMKPTAVLINTARGGLINEADLCHALENGIIAGAGLDVYCADPIENDNPLLKLENVVLTPHTAADTYESYSKVGYFAAQNIVDYFNGKNPKNLATPAPYAE